MGTKGCRHPFPGAELAQREVKVNSSPLNHDASNLYAACQQSINMHFTTMPECLIEGETASYSCHVGVCVYISSIFFNTVYQNKIIDFKAESHTLSEKTSGSFVSQVLIKYLLCDDPCVRHWDNCKIMVYSKLKNTIWLTETYILIFMLSVKIDWSLYR